jgi:phenylpropionate dioxygenase-like ring-hydroxylating dioxygenase large terminal subunit
MSKVVKMERSGILDPVHYSEVRRPLSQASVLPPWCYTSQEFYDRERESIFKKVWNPVGRIDQIPAPGNFFTTEIVGIPLIVVRDRQGQVRAFVNSCRHRGTQLASGTGTCRVFSCPYHSWSYSLEGELINTPGMEGVENFDRKDFPLMSVRAGVWAGFIFVNPDPDCESLEEYLGALRSTLACYAMEDMVCVRREVYDLNCNWKLLIENFKESYHLATVHRSTIQQYASVEVAGYEVEAPDGEYLLSFAKHAGSMALLKGDKGFPSIETLDDKRKGGSHFPLIYPAMGVCTTTDCCWWLQTHPKGPRQTRIVIGSLFPRKTVARSDFSAVVSNYYKRWDITVGEDNGICELQQLGLDSGVTVPPGRFGLRESNVREIHNWILDRVLAPQAPATERAQTSGMRYGE